jgi:hypothetical protein
MSEEEFFQQQLEQQEEALLNIAIDIHRAVNENKFSSCIALISNLNGNSFTIFDLDERLYKVTIEEI